MQLRDQARDGAGPEVGASAERKCLLIVEDDPVANDLLSSMLKEAGCETVQAFDGASALHLARTTQPKLITLDLALPGLDGVAVLKALKSHAITAHIPVLIISGTADKVPREARQGALAVVPKPFDVERVAELIRRILAAA
jgi:two-component system, OmpR family, response regulator